MVESELSFEERHKTVPEAVRKGRLYRANAFYPPETLQRRINLASEVVALVLTETNCQKAR